VSIVCNHKVQCSLQTRLEENRKTITQIYLRRFVTRSVEDPFSSKMQIFYSSNAAFSFQPAAIISRLGEGTSLVQSVLPLGASHLALSG
jgi:hypothetical protein